MALRNFLRGKIHRATLTECNVDYEGSISIDPVLLQAAGIAPFEQVDVYNINNGERLTTYAIVGGPGEIWPQRRGRAQGRSRTEGHHRLLRPFCRRRDPRLRTQGRPGGPDEHAQIDIACKKSSPALQNGCATKTVAQPFVSQRAYAPPEKGPNQTNPSFAD